MKVLNKRTLLKNSAKSENKSGNIFLPDTVRLNIGLRRAIILDKPKTEDGVKIGDEILYDENSTYGILEDENVIIDYENVIAYWNESNEHGIGIFGDNILVVEQDAKKDGNLFLPDDYENTIKLKVVQTNDNNQDIDSKICVGDEVLSTGNNEIVLNIGGKKCIQIPIKEVIAVIKPEVK